MNLLIHIRLDSRENDDFFDDYTLGSFKYDSLEKEDYYIDPIDTNKEKETDKKNKIKSKFEFDELILNQKILNILLFSIN